MSNTPIKIHSMNADTNESKLANREPMKTKEEKLVPNKKVPEDSLVNYEYDEEDDGVDWET